MIKNKVICPNMPNHDVLRTDSSIIATVELNMALADGRIELEAASERDVEC